MESRVSPLLRPYLSLFCIILADEDNNPESLIAMVREINKSVVDKEEYLGENIYLYKKDTGKISLVTE